MSVKTVEEIVIARPSSDGDGVKLLRVFGGSGDPARFDPFLMMDEFGSFDPNDYIGGFPHIKLNTIVSMKILQIVIKFFTQHAKSECYI